MPTRGQVLELIELGHSYATAGRALHIPPGQAFMIATGLPADGSDVPAPEEPAAKPVLPGSSQGLVNPPTHMPARNDRVLAWVRERAARELKRGA